MSAPSFDAVGVRSVELGGRAFFQRDGLMELWFAVLADALAEDERPAAWKWHLEDDLTYQATLIYDGLLVASLDAHLATTDRIDELAALCRGVRGRLAEGDFSPGPLAQRVGRARWRDELGPRLVRVIDAFLWLADQAKAERGAAGRPARAPER